MAPRPDHRPETGTRPSPWPPLMWIVFSAAIAVSALMVAPLPA
jgi:hypothetical protein